MPRPPSAEQLLLFAPPDPVPPSAPAVVAGAPEPPRLVVSSPRSGLVRVQGRAAQSVPNAPELAEQLAARLITSLPTLGLPRLGGLTVTANRRTMLTVQRLGRERCVVRVAAVLLPHTETLCRAIIVSLRTGKFPSELGALLRTLTPVEEAEAGPAQLSSRGVTHDLRAAVDAAARRLAEFPKLRDAVAGWVGSESSARRRAIRLGVAYPTRNTIALHRALDDESVPTYVVEMVVHHELCHLAAPPLSRAEATRLREHRIHHSRFRALERRFPRLDEANRWVTDHLDLLLRF